MPYINDLYNNTYDKHSLSSNLQHTTYNIHYNNPSPIINSERHYYIGNYEITEEKEKLFFNLMLKKIDKDNLDQLLKIICKYAMKMSQFYDYLVDENITTIERIVKMESELVTITYSISSKLQQFNVPFAFNTYRDANMLLKYILPFKKENKIKYYSKSISALIQIISNAHSCNSIPL